MCDFGITEIAIAGLVVSAAAAAASTAAQMQQQQAAKRNQNLQIEANKKQMQQNADVADAAYLNQAQQSNVNLAESREAAANANQDETLKRVQAQGAADVAGSEAGVGGSSLSTLLSDFHRQEDMFRQHNDNNLLFKQQQTGADVAGAYNTAAGRHLGVQPYIPAPIAPVDYVGPALSVAGTGVQMAGMKYAADNNALNKTPGRLG